MSNLQPLKVVDRGSETQPQVVEKLNKFTGSGLKLSLRGVLTKALRPGDRHRHLSIEVIQDLVLYDFIRSIR